MFTSSNVIGTPNNSTNTNLATWAPFLVSTFLLFISAYLVLWNTVWQTEAQSQGPLVLAICLFLFWQKRHSFKATEPNTLDSFIAFILLSVAVCVYLVGNLTNVIIFEVLSHIVFLMGAFLFIGGRKLLASLWFPIFFLIFMIPLPGFVVEGLTLPMKMFVSNMAEHVLYFFDYPIARDGVIIQIGFYKLLVADACAGLHTLISLEAIGILYLYLIKSKSAARNVTLAILIIPISLFANLIRVCTLVLITYYYGDEVGQSFIHDFSAFVLFFVALISIIIVDIALRKITSFSSRSTRVTEQ